MCKFANSETVSLFGNKPPTVIHSHIHTTGVEETNFYDVFGPVFHSNGRFASKLPVPTIGDDSTPFEQVFKFYEYWEVFESWRDFSLSNQVHSY